MYTAKEWGAVRCVAEVNLAKFGLVTSYSQSIKPKASAWQPLAIATPRGDMMYCAVHREFRWGNTKLKKLTTLNTGAYRWICLWLP